MSEDTIFALASAPGRAGIAVVRISGTMVAAALKWLGSPTPPARRVVRQKLVDPRTDSLLDDGLVIFFPGPDSYTGEDVAELHLHGGGAVLGSVLSALGSLRGLRIAEPGEFTRRAFEHGKLDLTQAEAVVDLVDAETRAQQTQALRQMDGALKDLCEGWRHRLIQSLAHLEAVIDFPDEGLPEDVADNVWAEVEDLQKAIAKQLKDGRRGERLRAGVMVAIVGPPNAGKSTLLNALARRDAAIVSEKAGTTRDVIEVHMDFGGLPLTVADTAGLREAGTGVEKEGIQRALNRARDADIKIALFDGANYPAQDATTRDLVDAETLVVTSKADLFSQPHVHGIEADSNTSPAHFISVHSGFGMEAFLRVLELRVREKLDVTVAAPITRSRHRTALVDCEAALHRAREATELELAAEDLRLAARALARIAGRVDMEELLDVVFRDFCIGK